VSVLVIGQRCEFKREELKLTRLQVANGAGIDPSSLYRFEKGKQALSVPRMARLAKVLGLSLDELVAP
jgi:transcriptional regulator with XRE-family HTH domain